jgi:hypothetical protein
MHFDWQVIITIVIVAIAAWRVGRIIASQVAGFRQSSKIDSSGCSGCDEGKKASAPQLITLSAAPLRRVVVPKGEEAGRTE